LPASGLATLAAWPYASTAPAKALRAAGIEARLRMPFYSQNQGDFFSHTTATSYLANAQLGTIVSLLPRRICLASNSSSSQL
jgi:hypothetical protein